ncbi:ATP-binding protein [Streptomyces sp. NPDC021020]|uniref:ATP-binding protein n=1 Tax=Streptomyces sp. NPDC021020 TaxID=3365109 RepID=UPI0037A88D9C
MIEHQWADSPATHTPPTGPPPTVVLADEPESAKAARKFVREFIRYYVPGTSEEHVDTVVLVACELVSNSLRYGTEPGDSVRVVLDADDRRTRIEVHDPVRRHPRVRPVSLERERGRGLLILDALCPEAWGVYDIPFGKATWAEVKAS